MKKNLTEFKKILARKESDEIIFKQAIKVLCGCLKQYYEKNVVILIDEYDVPLETAYFAGFYDKMVAFIRSLFESALKTNDALEFSVITGCLRISKESIFTGLNNLKVNTISSNMFSEYFGFTQAEVDDMLELYGLSAKREELKRWYDGYLFGDTEVYNPWSVVSQVDEWRAKFDDFPKAHWINTSSNGIVKTLIKNANEEAKEQIESLISGGSIEAPINENITYGDMTNVSENLWSFLYYTGYLKVVGCKTPNPLLEEEKLFEFVIPNIEVRSCYNRIIKEYFNEFVDEIDKRKLFGYLLNKDSDSFSDEITNLLEKSISFYDNMEGFYHGLLVGLIQTGRKFRLESNRENGNRRSDIAIYDNIFYKTAIIIEIKIADKNEIITDAAKRALAQIEEKQYYKEAVERGYKEIIKYGVAFKDKMCFALCE